MVDVSDRGNPIGVRLLSEGRSAIEVLEAGIADPYGLPVQPIEGLSEFSAQQAFGRMVHIPAVVTLYRRGTAMFVPDPTGPPPLSTGQEAPLLPRGPIQSVRFLSS